VRTSTFIELQFQYLQPYKILHTGYKPYVCDGKSIFKFPLNINLVRIFFKRLLPFFYTSFYNKSLQKYLLKNKFDVVLCNYGTQGSNVSPACYKVGVPLIVHFHGYDAYTYSILKKYNKKYKAMFRQATRFIVGSEDMVRHLVSLGAPKEKIVKILCGFDARFFVETDPEKNDKRLLFVGRFTEKKAPDILIQAFNHALKKVPDALLIMIGDGELFDGISAMIKNMGLEKSVQLMGWQSSEIVSQEIKKARAYVQHSRVAKNGDSEGTAITILEAGGSGVPVVSTRHAGIKETVIDGVTGYLCEEGDWESMGNNMVKLLQDPKLAGEMGRAARAHVLANHTVDKQMKMIEDTMNNVLIKNL